MRNLVLRFDMRTAPQCPDPVDARYQACIDMACWADEQPIDVVGFSEHHNSTDGFLSSPMMMAMAVATRTRRVPISVSALLVPLHDPIRLAEDIAVLDLVSNGRFAATAGLGYRQSEYLALGSDWQRRGKVFDEKLTVMLKAWRGDAFDYRGTRFQLSPTPLRPAIQLLTIGGNSAPAARRAARFKLAFCPAIDDPTLADIYNAACREQGFEGFVIFPNFPATTLIAEDPEQAWAEIGDYLLYDATAYGAWSHKNRRAYAESFANDMDGLKSEGKYRIVTPEQAVDIIRQTGSLHHAPLCGGVPIDFGWRSLELYANKVAPHLESP